MSPRHISPILVMGIGDIFPVRSGGQKAAYELYSALNRLRPCTYLFLDPSADGESEGTYPSGLPYRKVGGCRARSWRNMFIAPKLLYKDGPTRMLLRIARTPAIVNRLLAPMQEAAALIFVYPQLWRVVGRHVERQTVIYDSHNFELHFARERMAEGTFDGRSLGVLADSEASLSRRADALLACSSIDARSYVDEFGVDPRRIHFGFKGAAVPSVRPARLASAAHVAAFVGSDWPANNEAACFVASTVAPRLPDVTFRIFGSCCRALPAGLPGNVEAVGFVDDLDAELQRATLALNPITSGAGINMKLLEYLAQGVPVLTTEFGARGLPESALSALEVTTIEEFPGAVTRLLQSPDRLHDMSVVGHNLAKSQLDWSVLAERLQRLLSTDLGVPISSNTENCSP
ncbi:glycosyltransferase [Sphaerotilaceae bacterium SBD11-9]